MAFTDDQMRAFLQTTKGYTVVILKPGPNRRRDDAEKIIWEHGRRNFSLRADGLLPIVCPVMAEAVNGVGIFNAGVEETRKIMEGDPGVQAGIFVYELYPCRSFPGDSLPR